MTGESIRVHVAGVPVPQGSMRNSSHGTMIHSNPNLDKWRISVGWHAKAALPRSWSKAGAFGVEGTCYFARPKYLPKTEVLPIVHKNDIDKLARAILDAMSKIVYDDDGQVVDLNLRKRFGNPSVDLSIYRVYA